MDVDRDEDGVTIVVIVDGVIIVVIVDGVIILVIVGVTGSEVVGMLAIGVLVGWLSDTAPLPPPIPRALTEAETQRRSEQP